MRVRTLLYAPVPSTQLTFLTFIHEHWFGFIEKWILYLMHGRTVSWIISESSIKKWSNENYSRENKMKKKKESWLIHASHSLPLPLFSQFLLMMDISNMIYFSSHISHCIGIYITAKWCYWLLLLTDAHMHARTHMHTRGKRKFLPEGCQSNLAVSWCSNQQWQADQLHQLIM